jgi:hypothetical protein
MQVKSQVPARHTATAFGGVAQARPQPPQCIVLVCVLTSQPLAAAMSQLAKFAAHEPTAHIPALQAGVATLGSMRAAQLVPQVPQFTVSIVRSVQMPWAPPPQRFWPGGHTRSQLGAPASPAPVMQSKPDMHTVPQAPQLFRSVTETHAPLQSCCPEGQV